MGERSGATLQRGRQARSARPAPREGRGELARRQAHRPRIGKGSRSLGLARRSDWPRGGGIAAFDPTDLRAARPLSRRADGFVGPRPQQDERKKRLAGDVETIVASTLREQWLVSEAPPLAPIVAEIRARCEEAGLRPPSYVAIRARAAAFFRGRNRQAALGQSQTFAPASTSARIHQRVAAPHCDTNRPHAD